MIRWIAPLLAGFAALVPLSPVHATNGYFQHGYGSSSRALAGAGAALSQDTLAPATNPAGIIALGHRADLGVALFSPRRSHRVEGFPTAAPPGTTFPLEPGRYESGREYFLIPSFGYSRPLDARSSIGIALYGNGGMNTDWPDHANPVRGSTPPPTQGTDPGDPSTFNPCLGGYFSGTGTYCAGGAGVDYMQLFIAPTYARRVSDRLTLGVSPILAYQRFEATGVGTFAGFSNDPASLSDNGHDDAWGYGARFGLLFELSERFALGFAYQTKIDFSKFDDYAGLFAAEGDMDAPSNLTAGIAFRPTPRTAVLFDVQHIRYSEVDPVGKPMLPALAACMGSPSRPDLSCLGSSRGPGFGWEDMTIFKLGFQWRTAGDWTWRVGYSYGEQPIPSSEVLFNILAPGVMEHHLTFGFSKRLAGGSELNLAAMFAPSRRVRGPNPLDPAQTVELEMKQYDLELSWTWHFD